MVSVCLSCSGRRDKKKLISTHALEFNFKQQETVFTTTESLLASKDDR